MPPPGEGNLDAIVNEALAVQAAGDPDFIQQIDSALFKNARADARQDIFPGLALDDYVVDAVLLRSCPRRRPAGPLPMIATCVRKGVVRSIQAWPR